MNTMVVHVPLHQDQDGTIRVDGTRTALRIVIAAFDRGLTPEDMCRRYATLRLKDVYAVISYYLENQPDVRAYPARREKEAEELRQKIETELGIPDVRDQLTARHAANST